MLMQMKRDELPVLDGTKSTTMANTTTPMVMPPAEYSKRCIHWRRLVTFDGEKEPYRN